MIHLIGDYYMTADKKPGCSYVVGIPRQTNDNRVIMGKSRYYPTLAPAVSCTAEIALRDSIATGKVNTLREAVAELRRLKEEIQAAVSVEEV